MGEAVVLDASWLDEGLNILRSGYPSISWSRQQDGGLTGDGTALGFGRLDFILTHNHGCTHLYVQGSHHVEQKALIKKMAAHLGGLAFDAQTGQVLP